MAGGAERRRYKRYEIELPGQVRSGEGERRGCMVCDYCSGGMLARRASMDASAEGAVYRPGQHLDIELRLLTGDGSRAVRVNGNVAWIKGEYFGLSFAKSSDVVVEALKQHHRLAHTGTGASFARQANPGVIDPDQLHQAARDSLLGLMQELLTLTRENLLERANWARSNNELQQIYGDLNTIDRLHREDTLFETVFAAVLNTQSDDDQEAQPSELSLVNPDDFERWLEASRVATQLETHFGLRLTELCSRLARPDGFGDPASVPYEPKKLTGALKDAAKELEFGTVARSALFDQAGRLFEAKLGDLYDRIDRSLDSMGVPAAKLATTQSKPAKVVPERQSQRGADASNGQSEPAKVGPERASQQGADASSDSAKVIPIGGDQSQNGVIVDPAVLQSLAARQVQHREGLGRDLIAHVTSLPDMTDSLADWLEQIKAPLARRAGTDRDFFSNEQHPLRQIIDGLGHLQMFRAKPDLPPEEDPIRERVSEILEPVRRGETEESVLSEVARALGGLTGEQSRLYQNRVKCVVEVSEGRHRTRGARQRVWAELQRRYAGRQVPEVAPELLEAGWRALLELDAINTAGGNEQFKLHLGLFDSVVSLLGGQSFEPVSLESDSHSLFAQIQQGLSMVAFDPFRRNALETRLRRELLDPGAGPAKMVEVPFSQDEREVAAVNQRPDEVSQRQWLLLLERCAEVAVGDRVYLRNDSGGETGLTIAWIRSDGGVFVLVDHRGLWVKDITLAELALELHRRRIRVERPDGQPMSDRAVDAILARMEERLAGKPTYDSLTGLINRQQFHAAVQKALGTSGRADDIGVLLWLDIDQFRLVNDIHGYETGDRLLEAVARQLEWVKGAEVLGHLGADRFGLMLSGIGLIEGATRAEAVCEMVRKMPFDWRGQTIGLSASVGVVPLVAGNEEFNHLLQAADDTLAAAKAAGGDRGYVYSPDDPAIIDRKASVQWVVQVDEALDRGQLQLRCQPIVPVREDEGLAPHYEVLLGVRSGSAEPLPIAEFIDAAERYNRMRAVDRWVARTTMEWVAAHREHMLQLHGFAVNLSGHTASDPSFVDFVREHFQRTAIDPAWLSFEVTETAAVSDLSSSAGIIHELKSLGCKVALDDFGSGQASYSYLKELPVDWLKIDGVFVRKIATNSDDFAVVKSINEIGHFLGKKTIAEYVADDDILGKIREIGVDFAQGFGISPPLLMQDLLQTRQIA